MLSTIRKRLIAITLGAATVSSLLVVAAEQHKEARLVEQIRSENVTSAKREVLTAINEASRSGLLQATMAAGMPEVQAAAAARDLEAMKSILLPGFERLKRESGVKTFVVFVPPSTNFLRAQKPDRHGDDVSAFRPSVVAALVDGQARAGLARGRAGLSARGMAPVIKDGEVVAVIEVGAALGADFFENLAEKTGYDFEFYVVPKGDVETFDEVSTSLDRSAATIDMDPLLTRDEVLEAAAGTVLDRDVRFDEAAYISHAIPLIGLNGDAVGVVNILVDAGRYAEIRSDGFLTATIALVVALMFATALALWFGGKLGGRAEALTGQMRQLAEGDTSVEIPTGGGIAEFEAMSSALSAFKDNALRVSELAAEKADAEQAASAERAKMIASLRAEIGETVNAAIAGDFSQRVRNDFEDVDLQELSADVNRLIERLNESLGTASSIMRCLAEGDLTDRMEGDYDGAFNTLQASINGTIERLVGLVSEIQEDCSSMKGDCDGIAGSAHELSARTESQAAAVQQTAATLEQMSGTLRTNASGAAKARDLAAEATSRAEESAEVVDAAVSAMARIEGSATKISEIVAVINGIASQTNLLALNAAVEAARAGDAGKGFAVVASEVRTLAQRSSEAAQDIKELIADSATHVSEGAQLVRHTGGALQGITTAVSEVSSTIQEITSALNEQASSVNHITQTVSDMDGIAQQNAAMAVESASGASTISQRARRLADLVSFFHTTVSSPEHARDVQSDIALAAARS